MPSEVLDIHLPSFVVTGYIAIQQ